MDNKQRELVINDLVKFIDRVTNKKTTYKGSGGSSARDR